MTLAPQVLRTDWDGYLRYLEAAEGRRLRITYDRGDIELMSVSPQHERSKKALAQLVEMAIFELGMNSAGGGNTTFRRKALDRGLEPDECYWIASLPELPPVGEEGDEALRPDLVVEVEVTRSALNRMGIYAAFGVPEVWRLTSDLELVVEVLGPGGYARCDRSPTFPTLQLQEVPGFLRLGVERGSREMLLAFREWLARRA